MFSPPAFISIGDDYDKKNSVPDRWKGKNMVTNPSKKGAGTDTLFTKKVMSLSYGDKFVDPGTAEKRARIEAEKKKVTAEGFKYSSGPKLMCGSGTYFGTFQEKDHPAHQPEFLPTRAVSGDKSKNVGNFWKPSSPPHKGTFGFPGLAIGKGDEYKYLSDPYENEKRFEALKAKESSTRIMGGAFKASCRKQDFFDETNHGISKVFSIDKALPPKKLAEVEKPKLTKPWRPGGTLVNAITKQPEYQEDPYEVKEMKAREERKKKPEGAVAHPTWKPISFGKTLPCKPIKFVPS